MPFLIGTIASAVIGGKSLMSSAEGLLAEAGNLVDDVNDLITDITNNVEDIVDKLSDTYQDNMSATFDSLDEFTGNVLRKLTNTFNEINDILMQSVEFIVKQARELLEDLKSKLLDIIIQVEKSITKIIIVAGETASYVVDKVTYNLLTYSSFALFGIGLIIFITMLAKRGIPEGAAGVIMLTLMGIFILLFGAIGLIPKFRTYIIKFTGLGLKSRLETTEVADTAIVSRVFPNPIEIGKTKELHIKGLSLLLEEQQPTISINGINLTIKAAADEAIVVDVSKLNLPSGSVTLKIDYPDLDQITRIINVQRLDPPADLIVTKVRTNPKYPVVGQAFTTMVTVKNNGKTTAENFKVGWEPDFNKTVTPETVAALKPGQSTNVNLRHKYSSGKVYSTVARVDTTNKIQESKENNNTRTHEVSVVPTHWKVGFDFITFNLHPASFRIVETTFTIKEGTASSWTRKSAKRAGQPLNLAKTFTNVKASTKLTLIADLKIQMLHLTYHKSVKVFDIETSSTNVVDGPIFSGPMFLGGIKQKRTERISVPFGNSSLNYSLTFEWSMYPR